MRIDLKAGVTDFSQTPGFLFHKLGIELTNFFHDKHYGSSIEVIQVDYLMTLVRPGYENWYNPKKPKYIDRKKRTSRLTGETMEISKTLFLEIKLDENNIGSILNANEIDFKRIIVKEFRDYLTILKKLPGRVNDFDLIKFTQDLSIYLEELK